MGVHGAPGATDAVAEENNGVLHVVEHLRRRLQELRGGSSEDNFIQISVSQRGRSSSGSGGAPPAFSTSASVVLDNFLKQELQRAWKLVGAVEKTLEVDAVSQLLYLF
jgi:hypothetical protein